MVFGELLKKCRVAVGLSVDDAVVRANQTPHERAKWSQRHWYNVEEGKFEPSFSKACSAARAIGCKLDDLDPTQHEPENK